MNKKNGIDSLELRERNVKLLKKYVESERKSEEVLCLIVKNNILMAKKMVKDGFPEDMGKDSEVSIQKIHDKYIKKIDEMLADKEKEIMTV